MSLTNWQIKKAEYWKKFPPPARPWTEEVSIFEKYVIEKQEQGHSPCDVLVLGSTVELRSMCHKNKTNVSIVDFSKIFYDILSKQPMAYQGKEVLYEQNWLVMDIGKKFDLIFGDWVPNVLRVQEFSRFFENILRHLKDDGLFIARECLRPNREPIDLKKVVNDHNEHYGKAYSFYETSMHYVYGFRIYEETSTWNIPAAREAVEDVYRKGLLKKKDHDFFMDALALEIDHSMTIMVEEDFDDMVQNYFTIMGKHRADVPSKEWFPIYVLAKKGSKKKVRSLF